MGTLGLKLRITPEGLARRATGRRRKLDGLVVQMHRDYLTPMSLNAVARKYQRDRRSVAGLFETRGIPLRPLPYVVNRLPNGRLAPAVPLTPSEIDAAIDACTRIMVPHRLKREWREWSMPERRNFIYRMRDRLGIFTGMPTTKFSSNVEPFDYASERAQAIAAKANRGLNSRAFAVHLKISSVGVIWQDDLYFWVLDHSSGPSGAYYSGLWTQETARPALHHLIWEGFHGHPVPESHIVYSIDGNRNNLDAENLGLKTRNDLCRENQATALRKKSRAMTSMLLQRTQNKTPHANTSTIQNIHDRRRKSVRY